MESVRAKAILTRALKALAACGLAFSGACGMASLGGATAGARGTIEVVFLNNTDEQPVLTFGTYDNLDLDSSPSFRQITLDGAITLDPDGVTEPLSLFCGRVFSVGSTKLIDLIERNVDADNFDLDALVTGVDFYNEPTAGGTPTLSGTAASFEAVLGTDFPCSALLIIRLEPGGTGGNEYAITFELIPSSSTR